MTEKINKNIWLLLLYASYIYREITPRRFKEMEQNPDKIPQLAAEILTEAVRKRLRRSLSLRYRRRDADLNRVRGSIDMLRTESRQLLQLGKVACSFDELTVDTPENRFVKAALSKLGGDMLDGDMPNSIKLKSGDDLLHRCHIEVAKLDRAGVGNSKYSDLYRRVGFRTGRLDESDREMLAAARLVKDLRLPYDLSNKEDKMGELFEKAILGFYRFKADSGKLNDWKVHGGQKIQKWPVSYVTPQGNESMVPVMRLDILLESRSSDRRIVIDTKYSDMLDKGKGDLKFRSSDIYQMYAYLRSQDKGDSRSSKATGILLYGKATGEKDTIMSIQGHELHFVSVDLNADSESIRKRLLHIISRI